jgi:hypothetical protein
MMQEGEIMEVEFLVKIRDAYNRILPIGWETNNSIIEVADTQGLSALSC